MAQIQPLLGPIGGFVYTATVSGIATISNPLGDDKITVYQIEVDNTGNSSASFVKVYNAAAGADNQDNAVFIFKVEAATKQHITMPAGAEFGYFSFLVTSDKGDASATPTATANPVDIAVLYASAP